MSSPTPNDSGNNQGGGNNLVEKAKSGLIVARDFVHERTKPAEGEVASRSAEDTAAGAAANDGQATEGRRKSIADIAKDGITMTKAAINEATRPRTSEETKEILRVKAEQAKSNMPASAADAGSKFGAVVDQAIAAAQEKLSKKKTDEPQAAASADRSAGEPEGEGKKGLFGVSSAAEAGTSIGKLVDQGITKAGELINKNSKPAADKTDVAAADQSNAK